MELFHIEYINNLGIKTYNYNGENEKIEAKITMLEVLLKYLKRLK